MQIVINFKLATPMAISGSKNCLKLEIILAPAENKSQETESNDADSHERVYMAYLICSNISNVFLFLTFGVYVILPELRRPLFGKIIMTFIFRNDSAQRETLNLNYRSRNTNL